MAEHTNSGNIIVWGVVFDRNPIPLQAAKITEKSVYLKEDPHSPGRPLNSPVRHSLHSNAWDFYLSWEEAHQAIQHRAQDRVDALRRQLEQAKGDLGRIKGMKPPVEGND